MYTYICGSRVISISTKVGPYEPFVFLAIEKSSESQKYVSSFFHENVMMRK